MIWWQNKKSLFFLTHKHQPYAMSRLIFGIENSFFFCRSAESIALGDPCAFFFFFFLWSYENYQTFMCFFFFPKLFFFFFFFFFFVRLADPPNSFFKGEK